MKEQYNLRELTPSDIKDKIVAYRVDYNVPLQEKKIFRIHLLTAPLVIRPKLINIG